MKSDIDSLMQERNFDAIWVTGPAQHNPPMVYLTGGGHFSGELFKKRGAEPVLFCNPMERDEAARSGLPLRDLNDYPFHEYLREAEGNLLRATVARYRRILEDLQITSGRLAVYGQADSGAIYAVLSSLQQVLPELEIVGELGNNLLVQAMATKDPGEVERIRRMGQVTVATVGRTADFLTSHAARDEILVKANGEPLTVGDVKNQINLWLAEQGVENPHGTIFAIGRDAGVPHSSGSPGDLLRLGQTIVFDIFPVEAGGGYHYDFTRTWCLGYAPDEVLAVYEDVLAVYTQILSELHAGEACSPYQERTCDLFEARGHPTLKSNPVTQEGYVHSLGHGVGLYIHERPIFGMAATAADRLDPGVVVTIEPGLYYPERGLGVRLEDTVWVRPDGGIEILADYPLDLVLPLKAG